MESQWRLGCICNLELTCSTVGLVEVPFLLSSWRSSPWILLAHYPVDSGAGPVFNLPIFHEGFEFWTQVARFIITSKDVGFVILTED